MMKTFKERAAWAAAKLIETRWRSSALGIAAAATSTIFLYAALRDWQSLSLVTKELLQVRASISQSGEDGSRRQPPMKNRPSLSDADLQSMVAKISTVGKAHGLVKLALLNEVGDSVGDREERIIVAASGNYAQLKSFLGAILNEDGSLVLADLGLRAAESGQVSMRAVVATQTGAER